MQDNKKPTTLDELNKARVAEFEASLAKGELSSMTECAYGKSIGDHELAQKTDVKKPE